MHSKFMELFLKNFVRLITYKTSESFVEVLKDTLQKAEVETLRELLDEKK